MSSDARAESICITGLGLASSLGFDVHNSCAAARAGISRALELDDFQIKSSETGDIENAMGHQVPNATIGFEGAVRLSILSSLAVQDLLKNSDLGRLEHSRSGLYLALPNPTRTRTGIELIADDEIQLSRLEDFDQAPEIDLASFADRIGKTIVSAGGLSIPLSQCIYFHEGHCGAAMAVKGAIRDLVTREVDYAVVGGVDSLLEPETLQWLLETGRLKTDGVPVGLQPGEAGALLLLERYDTVSARGATVGGLIAALGEGSEEASLLSGQPPKGQGLGQAIAAAVAEYGKESCCPFWTITDQNGEAYRALEWGHVLAQLVIQIPELGEGIQWYPAMAFGDTGSASGFVAICMAVCAFERNYAVSDVAIVLSSSEDRLRSSILVAKWRQGE